MDSIGSWLGALTILLGALGFLGAVWYIGRHAESAAAQDPRYLKSKQFFSAQETLVWLGLIGAQGALWALVIVPLILKMFSPHAGLRSHIIPILLSLVGLYVLYRLPGRLFPQHVYVSPLQNHEKKMKRFATTGMLVATLTIINILLLRGDILYISSEAVKQDAAGQIQTYLGLHAALQNQLLILGAIIGLATLATGALRSAIISFETKKQTAEPEQKTEEKTRLPAESVLLYGLYFTMLLALVYIPAYLSLMHAGEVIRDTLYPLSNFNPGNPDDLQKKREAIETILMLGTDPLTSLQAGVAILTPLVGSIIAVVLGKEK